MHQKIFFHASPFAPRCMEIFRPLDLDSFRNTRKERGKSIKISYLWSVLLIFSDIGECMAKVKVGDRVRFLNDVGGGIVRAVLRSGVIHVEDESGFQIPMMESEVVLVTEGATLVPKPQPGQSIREALGDRPAQTQQKPTATPTPQPKQRLRGTDEEGDRLNIHLCYLVEEGGVLGQDEYEVFLVNESNYDLMILYTSGRNEIRKTRFAGIVPFDSTELLEHFPPTELQERAKTSIQILAYKADEDETFYPKEPMNIEIKVDGARFFKQNAFVENPFFDDPAIMIELVKQDKPMGKDKPDLTHLQEQMQRKKILEDRPKKSHPHTKKQANEPLVIDLHINELVDSTAGMEPKHMLEIQLTKVKEVMDRFQKPKYKGKQIVFIHGKGEGVLRKAVTELIGQQYPHTDIQDASFQEYGFGATKVTIK